MLMVSRWLTFEGIFPTQSTFQGPKGSEKGEKNKAIPLPGLQMLLLQCQDDLTIPVLPSHLSRCEQRNSGQTKWRHEGSW